MTSDPASLSRRAWFRTLLGPTTEPDAPRRDAPVAAAAPATGRACRAFPILRPPGAIEETAFLAGCTRCDACLEACPHDAIVKAPIRFRDAANTPMIDPIESPCRLCEDRPCATACEPGVIRADGPATMGKASIDIQTCLAHAGTFCTVCSEHCPVEGAIEVVSGKPRIVDATCTGCGICQYVCPAPRNAVLILPLAMRPAPPTEPLPETAS